MRGAAREGAILPRPARGARAARGAALPVLLALAGAIPGSARAAEEGCGNAGSFAEVAEGSRGRGPVVSRPSSLCADIERRAPGAVDVQVIVAPPGNEAAGERQGIRQRR